MVRSRSFKAYEPFQFRVYVIQQGATFTQLVKAKYELCVTLLLPHCLAENKMFPLGYFSSQDSFLDTQVGRLKFDAVGAPRTLSSLKRPHSPWVAKQKRTAEMTCSKAKSTKLFKS